MARPFVSQTRCPGRSPVDVTAAIDGRDYCCAWPLDDDNGHDAGAAIAMLLCLCVICVPAVAVIGLVKVWRWLRGAR